MKESQTSAKTAPQENMGRNIFLWLEFLILFGMVPLVYASGIVPLPKIPILLLIFLGCLAYLLKNDSYETSRLLNGIRNNAREIKAICLRAVIVALGCVFMVLLIDPAMLFAFPLKHPWLWLAVIVLYPLLSAYPQELIYRAFLFHRYKPILGSQPAIILASTIAFSFLHIIFGNWLAVILTIPAGYLFARVYIKTDSLLLASLEHALYGCIIFTVGLGHFFYTPS